MSYVTHEQHGTTSFHNTLFSCNISLVVMTALKLARLPGIS